MRQAAQGLVFPLISGTTVKKDKSEKGGVEEITSALTFLSSEAVLFVAGDQNTAKSRNACSSFEKGYQFKTQK